MTPNTHGVAATPYPPGFMVLHGNRLEDLRDLLTQFLRAQPLPPLTPEVILVQSNGMKHWLEMALADDAALGICAATRLELPSGYLWQVYRSVLGAAAVPAHMPFDKSHSGLATGAAVARAGGRQPRVRATSTLPGRRHRWPQALPAGAAGGRCLRRLPKLPRRTG